MSSTPKERVRTKPHHHHHHHHEGFMTSPRDQQSEERRKRAGYLYSKPKVGAYYQAKVPRFNAYSTTKSSSVQPSNKALKTVSSQSDILEDTSLRIENWKGDRRSKEYRELKRIHSEAMIDQQLQMQHQQQQQKQQPQQSSTTQSSYIPDRNPVCIHKPPNYVTDADAQRRDGMNEDDLPISASTSSINSQQAVMQSQNDFILFARNIFLQSTEDSSSSHLPSRTISNPWLDISSQTNHSNQRNGKALKKLKRKAHVMEGGKDELAPDSNPSYTFSISKHGIDRSPLYKDEPSFYGLETDENILEFLRRHEGDERRAKVALMMHLSNGMAFKSRKRIKRRTARLTSVKEEEGGKAKLLSQQEQILLSLERIVQQIYPTMLGDLRDGSASPKYNFHSVVSPFSSNESTKSSIESESEDLEMDLGSDMKPKARWKSFLSMTTPIIKNILSAKSNAKKPRLEEISSLLNTCITLPLPTFNMKENMMNRMERNITTLADLFTTGRDHLAKLMDVVDDADGSGIDLDKISTCIQRIENNCPVTLNEIKVIQKGIEEVQIWDHEVSKALQNDLSSEMQKGEGETDDKDRNDLPVMENLLEKAKGLLLHSKSMVQLEDKLERAYSLKRKIMAWQQTSKIEKKETVKFISALVREANKIGLMFPEVYMLNTLHQKAEDWTEHATRAIRYRVSLVELEQVIEKGEKLPLNVADQLEKLRAKTEGAHEWIREFQAKVPCPFIPKMDDSTKMVPDKITWLERIRSMLNNEDKDDFRGLLNLAVDGSRVPVDMEVLRLLNLEMEARNWSLEAKRLLSTTGRSAKIDEFYTHVAKGGPIRDKAPKSEVPDRVWSLQYEDELKATVKTADEWYDKYQLYFGKNPDAASDDEGETGRTSIIELREMVEIGEKSPVNLGSAFGKVTRILARAEEWLQDHRVVLAACGNKAVNSEIKSTDNDATKPKPFSLSLTQLNAAIDAASDLPCDLDDVNELRAMVDKFQYWTDQASLVVPKRQTKRNTRGKCAKTGDVKSKHSLQELIDLIEEASLLPNDINEDVDRLKTQLNDVQSWRLQAQCDLRGIITGFNILSVERKAFIAKEASKLFPDSPTENTSQDIGETICPNRTKFNHTPTKFVKVEVSTEKVDMKVNRLVSLLLDSTKTMPIYTIEEKLATFLDEVLSWCSKAAAVTPDEVLGQDILKQISIFIEQGDELMKREINSPDINADDIDELLVDLRSSWKSVVEVEQSRLKNLEKRGFAFREWVKKVEHIISASEKVNLSELQDVCQESNKYPTTIELVRKIRKKGKNAALWVAETKEILDESLKITMEVAKRRIARGDDLGLNCPELKTLRGHVRKSKQWALKVKKCSLEEGRTHIADIKKLIEEHDEDSFLVTMPDELKTLKLMIRGYCLCRNPYEGFMIGCDGCEEWYHGTCVGISEVQADRCEKYLCIRCCITRNYNDCTNEAIQILRKWKNKTELNKTRNHALKNFLKRLKKAEGDCMKWKSEIETCNQTLTKVQNEVVPDIVKKEHDSLSTETNPEQPSQSTDISIPVTSTKTNDNVQGSGNDNDTSIVENKEDSIKKAQSKLESAMASHAHATRRLESLEKDRKMQVLQMEREDQMANVIYTWCLKAGKDIFVPVSSLHAQSSRPKSSGKMSELMNLLLEEAHLLNIRDIPDVTAIINIFKILSWSLRALNVLSKKPLFSEVEELLLMSTTMKFPNDKISKFLRDLLRRTGTWVSKVQNALKPIPGETKPYDLTLLNELFAGARNIPMITNEEARLISTIEDKGTRHCFCGGPGDGSFMLSCDSCQRWFHGACVHLDQSVASSIVSWECHLCNMSGDVKMAEKTSMPQAAGGAMEMETSSHLMESSMKDGQQWNDVSPYAPDVDKLWPPIGLIGSSSANEALGSDYGESSTFDNETQTSTPMPPQTHPNLKNNSPPPPPLTIENTSAPSVTSVPSSSSSPPPPQRNLPMVSDVVHHPQVIFHRSVIDNIYTSD